MRVFAFVACIGWMSNVAMAVSGTVPVVVNTWPFTNATKKAWDVISRQGRSALDAVEAGISVCEMEQCDHTVGYGGSPDENGETTLDAMIMDGPSHDVGAVAALRRVKRAVSVARKVLENTDHTLLVGDQATAFALKMGFKEENLSTPYSVKLWQEWKSNNCQPNFWKNVSPDPKKSCGPYTPSKSGNPSSLHNCSKDSKNFCVHNHDTIGMVVIDKSNNVAAGTSSNGAKFKIPGRVGDSPIPGAGAYVDQEVGGAAATGDGDVMMRYLPSFHAVENMRRGMEPYQAAEEAMRRIGAKYRSFSGGIIAVKINGDFGAACHGIKEFPFSVSNGIYGDAVVKTVQCIG